MEAAKDPMGSLLDAGLFHSADIFGSFLVSAASHSEVLQHQRAECLVTHGDALFGERMYHRAMNMYKQALQNYKSLLKQGPNNARSSFSASSGSLSPLSLSASTFNENEVKFKIALCNDALYDHRAALIEMEGIPPKSRTLKMNMTFGKLYRACGNIRAAITCYKDCLRQCPFIFEAIISLAEMGLSAKDISLLFSQSPVKGGRLFTDLLDPQKWLSRYAEAQCCVTSYDYKGGLEIFQELLLQFPKNVHILLEIAKVELILGRNHEAVVHFEKVRSIDPYVVTYMDEYAILLKSKHDYLKLNKLVHELLSINPAGAETCVALSALWERRDERKALSYADKSIQIDRRHITGYIMKGNLALSLNRPESAVAALRGAQELRRDIRSYQGLVRAYLALSKPKEALFTAREAMKIMPQSAKALKLVGDVHAISTSGREKARKFYESALRLEPAFLGAALGLADLHIVEGRTKEAVLLLERFLSNRADDTLHIKLAQVLVGINMLPDALSHYQAALRINAQNEAAKRGLERLEKQMKGIDPDAPEAEEEDENEAEDAEGDQEEMELL